MLHKVLSGVTAKAGYNEHSCNLFLEVQNGKG